jgi:hypothetical protein
MLITPEPLSCSHRVDDDRRGGAVDDSGQEHDRARASTDDHREAFIEFEDPDRIAVDMEHVLVADAVSAGAVGDDRPAHAGRPHLLDMRVRATMPPMRMCSGCADGWGTSPSAIDASTRLPGGKATRRSVHLFDRGVVEHRSPAQPLHRPARVTTCTSSGRSSTTASSAPTATTRPVATAGMPPAAVRNRGGGRPHSRAGPRHAKWPRMRRAALGRRPGLARGDPRATGRRGRSGASASVVTREPEQPPYAIVLALGRGAP